MVTSPSPNNPSQDWWIALARWLVIAFAIFTLTGVVYGLILMPDYAARHLSEFKPNDFWTYEQTQSGLEQLGWPINTMVWVEIVRSLVIFVGSGLIGLLIFWRKSRDWFGLYLAFTFLFFGLGGGALVHPLTEKITAFERVFHTFGALGWQFFLFIFYFFPDGKPVPGWTRWVALVWVGYMILNTITPDWVNVSLSWLAYPLVFGALGSQIYRYIWQSSEIQRKQTKWIVATVLLFLMSIILVFLIGFDIPVGPDYGNALIWATFFQIYVNVVFLLFPVTITISILYYRLWDIDIIIRRTLQYTILTGLLALAYWGGIVVLQGLLGPIMGDTNSPLVTVISTLGIAALFNPLRIRVQDFIDRRFYRKRYDAEQTLARFAEIARDEVDMDKLTAALLKVVEETMQPVRLSVWLKQVPKHPKTGLHRQGDS